VRKRARKGRGFTGREMTNDEARMTKGRDQSRFTIYH